MSILISFSFFFFSFFFIPNFSSMTEAQPHYDPTALAINSFRNPFLLDPNRESIADHINYRISQIDSQFNEAPPVNFNDASDLIDNSNVHQTENVIEWSPNKRYCRLNTLLGKGAFKVVHKAMDLEEGYEVAWNVLQVNL
jgi:WNK lysine deficient protein kinase